MEMYLKFRQWLIDRDERFSGSNVFKRERAPSADKHQLALSLATAENLNTSLPSVLETLNDEIRGNHQGVSPISLCVSLTRRDNQETELYQGEKKQLKSHFLSALKKYIAQIDNTYPDSAFTLYHNEESHTLIPVPLFTQERRVACLFYCVSDRTLTDSQIRWRFSEIEETLREGLSAWCKTEDRIFQAIRSERAIYAAELHDSLAQLLGYLKLKSTKLHKRCQHPPFQELLTETEELTHCTTSAYRQTRELIVSSRLTLQSENISHAITRSIQEFEQQSAIVFELDNRLNGQQIPAKESLQVLYILRESLTNIVRHSHASHARVSLFMFDHEQLCLRVEDNGEGINPESARSDSFGLQIMQERAARVGADLLIRRRDDGGTLVQLTLPPRE